MPINSYKGHAKVHGIQGKRAVLHCSGVCTPEDSSPKRHFRDNIPNQHLPVRSVSKAGFVDARIHCGLGDSSVGHVAHPADLAEYRRGGLACRPEQESEQESEQTAALKLTA